MIELFQHKENMHDLVNPFLKLPETEVSMSKELIQKDIDRLENEASLTKNKFNKKNIQALIEYLSKLLRQINDESVFELCWHTDKEGLPCTYPMRLINEPLYKINICNYIEVANDEKLVEMNTKDIADIISFEFMCRDLGETHETIEEALKHCGVIHLEPASILTDWFKRNGDDMYKLSKSLDIEDTPYQSVEKKLIYDYFYSKEFKTKSYKDVVDYSCRYANTIIANNLIKNSVHNNIDMKLLAVNATGIGFMVHADNELDINDKLLDTISIRSFGRRFQISPRISVY